jgi:hypothetical protein
MALAATRGSFIYLSVRRVTPYQEVAPFGFVPWLSVTAHLISNAREAEAATAIAGFGEEMPSVGHRFAYDRLDIDTGRLRFSAATLTRKVISCDNQAYSPYDGVIARSRFVKA